MALLGVAGATGAMGLLALCGRPGRVSSPMAFCPYDPGSAVVFLTLAGATLGLAAWLVSMTRRPGCLRWFVLSGLVVAGMAAALS